MKQKCDSCKWQVLEENDAYCAQGEWFGFGDPRTEPNEDLWADCNLFEPVEVEK